MIIRQIYSYYTFYLFHDRDRGLLDGDYPYLGDHSDRSDHVVSGEAIENGYDVFDDRYRCDLCRDHVVHRRDVYDVHRSLSVFAVLVHDELFLSIPVEKIVKLLNCHNVFLISV